MTGEIYIMKKVLFVFLCVSLLVLGGCGDSKASDPSTAEENPVQSPQAEPQDGAAVFQLGEFSAVDLEGNEVTQDVLKNSKITMLNIWATFCGPCFQEMPGLGQISDESDPEKFQIIGLITDVYSEDQSQEMKALIEQNIETAKAIEEETGADYLHLRLNGQLYEKLSAYMQYVPTTIFLDSEGNQVGEIYSSMHTKDEWLEIIDEVMKEAGL